MGVLTTVVLVFLNLLVTLGMSWWLYSLIEMVILFLLMGLGAAVFYAEETGKGLAWRAHIGYWALSLANLIGLYLATRASGLLLLLLVINLVALLRAISRLDALESGIVWPVTETSSVLSAQRSWQESAQPNSKPASKPTNEFTPLGVGDSILEGESQGEPIKSYQPIAPLGLFPNWPMVDSHSKPGLDLEPDVLLDDEPGVQVELETYKDGDNAVPIVRTQHSFKDIDLLMRQVSQRIKKVRKSSLKRGKQKVQRKSKS